MTCYNTLFRCFLEKPPLHGKTVHRMEATVEDEKHSNDMGHEDSIGEYQKVRLQIRYTFVELVAIFGKGISPVLNMVGYIFGCKLIRSTVVPLEKTPNNSSVIRDEESDSRIKRAN